MIMCENIRRENFEENVSIENSIVCTNNVYYEEFIEEEMKNAVF
jgi:hypothetical protein